MKVIYGLGSIKVGQKRLKSSSVAIGIFDGIHRGHQLLIKSMVQEAKKLNVMPVVITFFPHPAHVLRPDMPLPYLMSLEHRLKSFEQLGVELVLVVRFNKRFAHIDPMFFIEKFLVAGLGVKSIFVGEDFHFGKDRKGDIKLFKECSARLGYRVHALKTLKQGEETISSSLLRRLIAQGQLKKAQKLLGRPVSILGTVVHGASRGRVLGYPTANVQYASDVLPPSGVYAVRVLWKGKTFYGMANLGVRPSFKERHPKVQLEVHIFDFNHNLYGHDILVEFVRKIRDEKTFPSLDDLILQIQKDERSIRSFLKVN